MHFVRLGFVQQRLQFLNLTSSRGLRPAVSISTRSRSASRPTACRISSRRRNDFHRQIDDVGIGPQLFDRRDAIGVDRDQPHPAFCCRRIMGRQLGDRRRFADAGRTDQRHQPALLGGRIGSGPATSISRADRPRSRMRLRGGLSSRAESLGRQTSACSARPIPRASSSGISASIKWSSSRRQRLRGERRRGSSGARRRAGGHELPSTDRSRGKRDASASSQPTRCRRCATVPARVDAADAPRAGIATALISAARGIAARAADGSARSPRPTR